MSYNFPKAIYICGDARGITDKGFVPGMEIEEKFDDGFISVVDSQLFVHPPKSWKTSPISVSRRTSESYNNWLTRSYHYVRHLEETAITVFLGNSVFGVYIPVSSSDYSSSFVVVNPKETEFDSRVLGRRVDIEVMANSKYTADLLTYSENGKVIFEREYSHKCWSQGVVSKFLSEVAIAKAYKDILDDEIMVVYVNGDNMGLYGFSDTLRLVTKYAHPALLDSTVPRQPYMELTQLGLYDVSAHLCVPLPDLSMKCTRYIIIENMKDSTLFDTLIDLVSEADGFEHNSDYYQLLGTSKKTQRILKATEEAKLHAFC